MHDSGRGIGGRIHGIVYTNASVRTGMTRFSWDEKKDRANRRKHGVSFEAATRVFRDPFVIFEQDRDVDGEPRWRALGRTNNTVLLLVAHAYEEDDEEERIRIISARQATSHEEKVYIGQFHSGG